MSRPAGIGGGIAHHNFVVSNANYIGDPNATVHSFGQNSDLNMGNVGPDGSPSSVAEQTYADDYAFWTGLGRKDACMVDDSASDAVSSIPAPDAVVDDLASRVKEDQDYSLLTGPFSVNSNSAAQAIANRAAGREVPTPGGWSPGAGKADRVRFSGDSR